MYGTHGHGVLGASLSEGDFVCLFLGTGLVLLWTVCGVGVVVADIAVAGCTNDLRGRPDTWFFSHATVMGMRPFPRALRIADGTATATAWALLFDVVLFTGFIVGGTQAGEGIREVFTVVLLSIGAANAALVAWAAAVLAFMLCASAAGRRRRGKDEQPIVGGVVHFAPVVY